MFLSDPQPNEAVDGSLNDRSLPVDDPLPFDPAIRREPQPSGSLAAPVAGASTGEATAVAREPQPVVNTRPARRPDAKWWGLAASFALLLVLLTVGGVWLIAKKPSTIDQLVILTVPSGAEIKLDSTNYGYSPVKLEQVPIGTYTLTITKEGYEPIITPITISDSDPLEFKLTLVPPSDSEGLTVEEKIKKFEQQADEAFARGDYAIPFEESALHYTISLLDIEPTNQFGLDMQERLRKKLLQVSQAEAARNDMGKAQEIINLLLQYYPKDEEVRAAAARLDNQISSRRGDLQNLIRKAEEALRAGNLTEPYRTSAYYYARQALTIDRTNSQALAVRQSVKERLLAESDQSYALGEVESTIRQLNDLADLFPEDANIKARRREITAQQQAEITKATDPKSRRIQGLDKYREGRYSEAIPHLEFATVNGQGTLDVVFALARSLMIVGRYDQAARYFKDVAESPSGDESYRSAIAALGDIAANKGDTETALQQYKKARQLGGSTLYTIGMLDDKIERIERRNVEKAAEPAPFSVQVKHLHGGIFKGSCSGTLKVGATGVSYDGDHAFSANLIGVTVNISKDEMTVSVQNDRRKFKLARSDAEHFRETLTKYQNRR